MNQDQFVSLVTSVLKIAGSALAAHGLTADAQWLNGQDVTGVVLTISTVIFSHFYNADAKPTSTTSSTTTPSK